MGNWFFLTNYIIEKMYFKQSKITKNIGANKSESTIYDTNV